MKQNNTYFKSLHANLQNIPGARSIVTNAITGSLLIMHSSEMALETLANLAVREGLFELSTLNETETAVEKNETAKDIPLSEAVEDICKTMDEGLRRLSDDQINLKSATFMGLVGLGLYQVVQGRALPAAISLFDDALHVLKP